MQPLLVHFFTSIFIAVKWLCLFVAYLFLKKLVTDNLPDLNYKTLKAAFQKYVTPYLLLGFITYVAFLGKLTSDPIKQKNYSNAILMGIVAYLLQEALSLTNPKIKFAMKEAINNEVPS